MVPSSIAVDIRTHCSSFPHLRCVSPKYRMQNIYTQNKAASFHSIEVAKSTVSAEISCAAHFFVEIFMNLGSVVVVGVQSREVQAHKRRRDADGIVSARSRSLMTTQL